MALKVYICSSPCAKAATDLEKVAALLTDQGISISEQTAGVDAVIVFGCGFIDDAKRESIDSILTTASLKSANAIKRLIVVGCLPEKYSHELAEALPEVDAFVGLACLESIGEIIRNVLEGSKRRIWIGDGRGIQYLKKRGLPKVAPWTRTVMISDGCDNRCTYCSIPVMRGSLQSRPLEDILDEIGLLVRQGAREIVIAGQDTASYGKDLGGIGFPNAVKQVAEAHPECWIRVAYANPDNIDEHLANVMGEFENICNYLDMPIQHASPRILRAMGRRDDPSRIRHLVSKFRSVIRDITLRTSVIVGFPGETESDFEELKQFLLDIEFDLVGVFAFSPQPDTPASKLPAQVPEDIKQDRLIEIVSIQEMVSKSRMERLVGARLQALVEDSSEGIAWARSQYDMKDVDRMIRLPNCKRHKPGELTRVLITGIADSYEWTGICLDES